MALAFNMCGYISAKCERAYWSTNNFSFQHCAGQDQNMLSGILIFNQKGENLIFRAFRNDCRPRMADVFRIQVISNAQVRSPILTLGSTTFSHVKHENIYLVAVTKSNVNAALVFEFLYRFVGLGRGYFGKFDEEAVKNNFVLVYELLDGVYIALIFRIPVLDAS